MKIKKFIYIFTFINLIVLSVTVYAASWLVKINDKEVMDVSNFENEYDAFIDLQAFSQPLGLFATPEAIKETKEDNTNKQVFLNNIVNDLIISEYAKEKNLYNESSVEKRTKAMSNILKRMIVKQIFIQKEIIAKTDKIDSNLKRAIYKKINEDPKMKKLSQKEKREIAENQAKMQQMQKKYILSVDKLRSRYKVEIEEKYQDKLDE